MLQIIDYSEKAVAVIGDTKEIRNELKAIGGRFNPRLSCGAGWIFSAKKRAEIEKVLADAEAGTTPETAKKQAAKKTVIALPAPRVYCGTYEKYNRGSIAGAWVTITDFKSGAEVVKHCCNLHKDEADPELMFQDKENFPDQFYGESMNAKDFDNVLQWYAEELKELSKPTKKIESKGFEDMKPEFLSEIKDDGYYKQSPFAVLKLPEGWLPINKSTIETTFWVGEGSYRPMEEALKICDHYRTKEGFMENNLFGFGYLETAKKTKCFLYKDGERHPYGDKKIILLNRCFYEDLAEANSHIYGGVLREATAEEKAAIIAAETAEYENFKKRLETWWKRYGADHIHADTYWADR